MSLVQLSRAEWGADPNLPRRGHSLGPANRSEVFIHHTVITNTTASPNAFENAEKVKAAMRRLQTIRPDLGLDVPYNFVAFCMENGDLALAEGRGLERTGAHSSGHNRSAIGIAFQGNFEDFPPPPGFDTHLELLSDWLTGLRRDQGFINLGTSRPAGRDVFGHRDVKATACPGRHLFDRLAQIRFIDDSRWSEPGDPIVSDEDARTVIRTHGALDPDDMSSATLRRSIAVILDEILQLKGA